MINNLTCIVCPMGCQLKVEMENGKVISVEGNTCPRGLEYAKNEMTNPMRTITTTVRTADGKIVPVKTDGNVPKGKMFDCMKIINELHPEPSECKIGNVIYKNILDSGVNVVVTANYRQD